MDKKSESKAEKKRRENPESMAEEKRRLSFESHIKEYIDKNQDILDDNTNPPNFKGARRYARYKIDSIPVELNSKLKQSLNLCSRTKYDLMDVRDGFAPGVGEKDADAIAASLSRNFSFFNLQDPQLSIIKEILEYIKLDIVDFLKVNFKIMNVRAYETSPSCEEGAGPNSVHSDGGFFDGTHKVLLYVNGADIDHGTTIFCIEKIGHQVSGPPGTYLLFNPKTTQHKGIIPEKHKKILVEITLYPWEDLIIEPIYGGSNGVFPLEA